MTLRVIQKESNVIHSFHMAYMAVYLVPTHLFCLNSCHFLLFLLHNYSSMRLSYMKLPILNILDYKNSSFTFQPITLVYSSHYVTSLWTPACIQLALLHLLPHTQPLPTFTWLILTHLLGLCLYSPFRSKLFTEKKGGSMLLLIRKYIGSNLCCSHKQLSTASILWNIAPLNSFICFLILFLTIYTTPEILA